MGPNTYPAEWSTADDDFDTAMAPTPHDIDNGADAQLEDPGHPQEFSRSKSYEDTKTDSTRDRQVKPNKVYVGGLPDHTRPDDLRNCFGKIGKIVTIELKLGYGFVEFDSKEAAEESVARYHEGFFMGNKIRVEPSHSRGRTFKRPEDPGACFNCGENGHWARECPRPSTQSRSGATYEQPSRDRGHTRDYNKEGYSSREDHPKHTSSRENRYYDTSSGSAPPAREHRRALTPTPRERRDYPSRRDYDDYRMRSPPAAQPASRHDRANHRGADRDTPSGAPPQREAYDRYDRRHSHSDDRSVPYAAQTGRPRTPPGPPPSSGREEYDKGARGNYSAQESRRRPVTPPPPYPGNNANGSRSRRRSLSPPPRYGPGQSGSSQYADGERYNAAPREGTRVRDYYRGSRGEDSSHRRS